MTSFMGPMAPPPPAQPQPQAMDFQTDPNNRQRFRQFLNNRMQPPMMQQPSMMQAPMMQPPAHMPPILPEIDIFAPQGYADGGIVGFSNGGSTQPIEQRVMKNGQIGLFRGQTFLGFKQEPEKEKESPLLSLAKFKEVLGLEDGGSVPPRRTDIRGQDHMLSYITPDEADILMALGGSGEAGPMGIPAYIPDDGNRGSGNDTSNAPSGPSGGPSGGDFGGSDADEEGDASQVEDMFDSYDDSGSDADEQGDAIAEQAVIDQIISDNDSGDAINQAIQNAMSSGSDRVGAGFVDPANVGNVGTGPTPEVNLTRDTRDPESYAVVNPTGIAAVDNRSTRGPDSGRGVGLLGLDDLLADQFTERGLVTDADPRSNQVVLGGGTDNMNLVNTSPNDLVDIGAAGLGVNPNPNIPDMATGTPDPNVNMLDDSDDTTATPAQNTLGMEDEYLDEDIAAGFGPGGGGLDTFASRQQRAADYAKDMGYDLTDRSVNKRGAERGFGGITDQQRADLEDRAARSIFGDTFMNTPRNINKILDDNRATGIYTNPDGTVRGVTGLPDPEAFGGLMQQGVNFVGGFMPNFIGETYTGTGADPFDRGEDPGGSGGDGPDQRVKAPADPCPPGYSLVNGTCTPVADSGDGNPPGIGGIGTGQPPPPPAPVIVPSPRQSMPFVGTMPSGYGTAVTGGVNPQVMSEMQKYAQLLSRPQPQYPVGLANGGPVSSNLDMAADNFLKALMPAA